MFEELDFKERINIIAKQNFPTSYPIHWHTQVELIFLSPDALPDDSLSVVLNQTTYQVHKGDLLLVWPGELHEILTNNSEHVYGIQFSPDLINSLPEFAEKYNLFRHEHFISAEHSLKTSSEMIAQLLSLANCHKTDNPYRGIEMLIHLYSCFLIYAQYIDSLPSSLASLSKPRNKEAVQKINTACNYIAKCCTQPLSLDEVADYTCFSIYYFSRIFKQVTGYSFTEYLAKQRIAYAQRLLSDSTLSITEIAFQAGFKSIPTFNRVFKRLEGYSPSEFKEMYANS